MPSPWEIAQLGPKMGALGPSPDNLRACGNCRLAFLPSSYLITLELAQHGITLFLVCLESVSGVCENENVMMQFSITVSGDAFHRLLHGFMEDG